MDLPSGGILWRQTRPSEGIRICFRWPEAAWQQHHNYAKYRCHNYILLTQDYFRFKHPSALAEGCSILDYGSRLYLVSIPYTTVNTVFQCKEILYL
jgi:hypothetical protein